MEAKTDIQTYLEQGKQALAQGQGREAAIAYAHGAQIEADNPMVHLGLAEANLALGNYGVVQMACRRVQELQPTGGIESSIAQALLDLLDRRYERALQNVDAVIGKDPGIAYVHALRSFLLRAQGQDYDANLARARAARLSFGGRFEGCFPTIEPRYDLSDYSDSPTMLSKNQRQEDAASSTVTEREPIPTWSRPNRMQRQMIRTRFFLSQYPGIVTYGIIGLNILIFLLAFVAPGIVQALSMDGLQIAQGQYWRLVTSVFVYGTNYIPLIINMLSLYFIGRAVEMFYGPIRYLSIYLLSGAAVQAILLLLGLQGVGGLGATSALFGVFGALGVFFLVHRNSIYGRGAISSWLFWLAINLVWSGLGGSLIILVGSLLVGMIIAFILVPRGR